jgi:hypothetical protein
VWLHERPEVLSLSFLPSKKVPSLQKSSFPPKKLPKEKLRQSQKARGKRQKEREPGIRKKREAERVSKKDSLAFYCLLAFSSV